MKKERSKNYKSKLRKWNSSVQRREIIALVHKEERFYITKHKVYTSKILVNQTINYYVLQPQRTFHNIGERTMDQTVIIASV